MTSSRLFIFVLGVLLHTVGQTCLPREGGDLEEKIGVAVNAQGHQDGSDGVKQVGCHHRPEGVVWDAEGSRGARMEGPPDVNPLALEEKTQGGKTGEDGHQARSHCCSLMEGHSKHVVFHMPPEGMTPRNRQIFPPQSLMY